MGCNSKNRLHGAPRGALKLRERNLPGDTLNGIDEIQVLRGTAPASASTPPPGLAVPSQALSIQEGIFLAFPGETVTVAPGTYEENIHFLAKNVVLTGSDPNDLSVVLSTIIDGGGKYCTVQFAGTESSAAMLTGFTIRNGGHMYFSSGGGTSGGGTTATISHNFITGNTARNGAGMASCHGAVRNNIIAGNTASFGVGGGLYSCNGQTGSNDILANTAQYTGAKGGGAASCTGAIKNNIFWGNTAPANPQLSDSSVPTYCCIQGWTGGGLGNTTSDPQFADADGPDNNPTTYLDNDYHIAEGSPCIDTGINEDWMAGAFDLDGEPRLMLSVLSLTVDIGMDEAPRPPDTIPPVITLLGSSPVSLEVGTPYVEPGYTATDNYDGNITASVVVTGSVNQAVVGSYVLHYNVSDSSGNSAVEKTRTVNVVDTTAPVITLLGDNPMSVEVGTAYVEPGYTATDNYDGNITSNVVVTGSVNHMVLGSYILHYNMSDSSDNPAAEKTRTVNVVQPSASPSVLVAAIAGVQSGEIAVDYVVRDNEGDPCDMAIAYSVDGGQTWQDAAHGTGGDGRMSLTSSMTGEAHTFIWDSIANIGGADIPDSVELKIVASDAQADSAPATTGPFSIGNSTLDADNDHLPDNWELLIVNANPGDEIRSSQDVIGDDDFDGDGKTNREEYVAGTDAVNAHSLFLATIQKRPLRISWPTGTGKFYLVYCSQQSGTVWVPISGELPGDGSTHTFTEGLGVTAPCLFYRVASY